MSVSNWIKSYLKQSFLKNYHPKVAHNGIDIDVFYPKEDIDLNKFPVLGMANVWNTNDFIELATRLDKDIQLILVGVSTQQKGLLPDNIITIERTRNADELSKLYSSANVYANLTYADTFPTANIESLACGTPVITYRTGGSPGTISEDTGFVIEQGDLDGVVNAINEIKAKGKGFYRTKCRERAVKYFRKEDRYNDYIKLYENILKDSTN